MGHEPDIVAAGERAPQARSNRLEQLLDAAWAPNTRRAYAADLRHFAAWCDTHGRGSLPASAETVAEYLAAHADVLAVSTLQRRLSAISKAHQVTDHPSPTDTALVRRAWRGLRRTVAAEAPQRAARQGKAPLLPGDLRAMVVALPDSLSGARDACVLLAGFAGGLRRSELVAIDLGDLQWRPEGLVVSLRRSKTDQEGAGRLVGIPHGHHAPTCPVRATRRWIEVAGLRDGRLLRSIDRHDNLGPSLSGHAVAQIVQRAAAAAGLDARRYGGHSLRAGLATAAAQAGRSERAIAAQTGHRSVAVLRGYIRDGSLFRDNAATGLL